MSTRGFAAMPPERRREIARQGGSIKNPKKGFGSMPKEERPQRGSAASRSRWDKVKAERQANAGV